jgi:heme-degrading monooxygenase HmoA
MITFVNVFTVLPERQQEAFENIKRVYTEVVRYQPGFISARLLVSDDQVRVTAIAQWERVEDLLALRETQGFKDLHNEAYFEAIVSNDPHTYSTEIPITKSS